VRPLPKGADATRARFALPLGSFGNRLYEDADLSEQLAEAVTNIHAEIPAYESNEDEPEEENAIPADPNVRNYSYTTVDEQIYYRQDSIMVLVEMPVTAQNRVKGLIELRECVRTLIFYQTMTIPTTPLKRSRQN
jgi:hypothetical protein